MNDKESPSLRDALDAVDVPPLRPWERLIDLLRWSDFIAWLREDLRGA